MARTDGTITRCVAFDRDATGGRGYLDDGVMSPKSRGRPPRPWPQAALVIRPAKDYCQHPKCPASPSSALPAHQYGSYLHVCRDTPQDT